MSLPRLIARRFWRLLSPILAVGSLMSAAILMPGVVGAALKASHPAIPAVGETLGYYAQAGSGDLNSNSQSVITNPKADLIFEDDPNHPFWEQTFSDPDPRVNYGQTLTNMQVVKQYFTDVNGSALESLLTQYSGISDMITLSNAVMISMNSTLHSDQCGTNTISDSGTDNTGIAPDIWNAVATQAPIDSSTIYFVFTPPGFHVYGPNDSCSQDNCGYHNDFLLGEGIYAVIPFGGGHCKAITSFSDPNDVQIDINTASHEQFEAITDPGAFQFGTSSGWYDSQKQEIGDKCGGSDAVDHPGVYLNGHVYDDVQGEYDNGSPAVDHTTGQPLKCAYTVHPPSPTPTPTHTPVTTHTACSTSPSYSHCDGYDPPGSHCSASYGAYNVGRYPGDYTWLQIWYDSTCKSNYILVNWPSPAPSCGSVTCNAIATVLFERTIPGYSGTWCNENLDNQLTCADAAFGDCAAPGQCAQGTSLYYCAKLWANCAAAGTFNGEYIGTTSGWQSFYTDLLYAPSQAVQTCVYFFNTSYPNSHSNQYCSQWH
jgi:hypothetical protein